MILLPLARPFGIANEIVSILFTNFVPLQWLQVLTTFLPIPLQTGHKFYCLIVCPYMFLDYPTLYPFPPQLSQLFKDLGLSAPVPWQTGQADDLKYLAFITAPL